MKKAGLICETSRLIIRDWLDTDFMPFCQMNADPKVMKYFPSRLTPSESRDFLNVIRQRMVKNGYGLWAVEKKRDGTFIGFVGLNSVDASFPFFPRVEIGWRLLSAYWGVGYASEAAQAVLAYAFKPLNLAEIVSFTAVQNTPSQRVMQKIGLQFNKEYFNHPFLEPTHSLARHCLYRLTASDYERNAIHKTN